MGNTWDKATKSEDRNYTSLLEVMTKHSHELKSLLGNAQYLSPKIQNEFIKINADLIRKSIVDKCNTAVFWSIMVDEAPDVFTKEQFGLCIRYVRENMGGPHSLTLQRICWFCDGTEN